MPEVVWSALEAQWADEVGHFDGIAVYERLQASRSGFVLVLLRGGESIGFVKVREGGGVSIENEFQALSEVADYGPDAFLVPQPVAAGAIGGWHYLVTSVLHPELHRMPVDPPLAQVLRDVRNGLSSLGRPTDTPDDWEPMHGDFTPWNLRERSDGSLFLIDWEDAAWAPPGADRVLYRSVEAVLTGSRRRFGAIPHEARLFWVDRLRGRRVTTGSDRDAGLVKALLGLLED